MILYHSQSGNTEKLAKACLLGAEKEEIQIRFKKAFDTTIEDVLWSDGLLIGTPENFGYMSGAVKDFFDRTYYPARELAIAKPFALFISCENDGSGAVREINKIATGYVLKQALEPIIIKGEIKEKGLASLEELGQTFAAGILLEIF